MTTDLKRLRAFVRDLFAECGWPEGNGIDGFALQDLAVKHGILRAEVRYKPCAPNCSCAEYHGTDEMREGVTCYRKARWLR